jgi:hypothetical protein
VKIVSVLGVIGGVAGVITAISLATWDVGGHTVGDQPTQRSDT